MKKSRRAQSPNEDRVIGPLVVSKTNPRYFSVSSEGESDRQAVYLTGSHIWNNFHDGMGPGAECAATSEQLDFGEYLTFLKDHGHNFIRLWRWEHFKSQAAGGNYHLCMNPQRWLRKSCQAWKQGFSFSVRSRYRMRLVLEACTVLI